MGDVVTDEVWTGGYFLVVMMEGRGLEVGVGRKEKREIRPKVPAICCEASCSEQFLWPNTRVFGRMVSNNNKMKAKTKLRMQTQEFLTIPYPGPPRRGEGKKRRKRESNKRGGFISSRIECQVFLKRI